VEPWGSRSEADRPRTSGWHRAILIGRDAAAKELCFGPKKAWVGTSLHVLGGQERSSARCSGSVEGACPGWKELGDQVPGSGFDRATLIVTTVEQGWCACREVGFAVLLGALAPTRR